MRTSQSTVHVNTWTVVAMFALQGKAQQWNERLVDTEKDLQKKLWRTFIYDEEYQQQLNESNYVHLNTWIRL